VLLASRSCELVHAGRRVCAEVDQRAEHEAVARGVAETADVDSLVEAAHDFGQLGGLVVAQLAQRLAHFFAEELLGPCD
jgi:hypothetical protein